MGVKILYPDWTEPEMKEKGAIQHLRSNELRDHINNVLFPYVTLIMPHARLVSWLVWIYFRLEFERVNSKEGMHYPEYIEKAARYYGIFATADILHARTSAIEHRGPVEVQALTHSLDKLGPANVDFRTIDFGSPRNPVDDYKNGLVRMGLLNPMPHRVPGRREKTILVPTEAGKKLALSFQDHWSKFINPEKLVDKLIWTQSELAQLGELICLQGLSQNDEEAKTIFKSARSSLDNSFLFDEFVDLTLMVAREYSKSDLMFKAEDVARAAFYWKIKTDKKYKKIEPPESESAALIAYHELHTHGAFGADAVLCGIIQRVRGYNRGIPISSIIDEACEALEKIPSWKPSLKYHEIAKLIKENNSSQKPKKYQLLNPPPNGQYGFETIQSEIESSKEKPPGLVAWGSIALFQAACAQELFEKSWLRKILPEHREVFASYKLLEELQMLPPDATVKDWIKRAVNYIIEQHRIVSDDKGAYSKRIEQVGEHVYYRAEADCSRNRGRFPIAITWFADLGLLQRKGNEYRIAVKEI